MKLLSISLIVPSILLFFLAAPVEAETSPEQRIKGAIDEVRELVLAKKANLTEKQLEKEVKEVVKPVFNFDEMSRRSLGSNWDQGSPDQQKEFIDLFSELLARSYIRQVIDGIENSEIEYLGERIRKERALVKLKILGEKDPISITYRLQKEADNWRVYDAVIENVGLVSNYRNEFAGIIRKDGFGGLLQQLREKVSDDQS